MTTRPTARRLLRAGAALAIAGAAVGGGVAGATPTVYTATATSVLTQTTFRPPEVGIGGWMQSVTTTYAALATRPLVLRPVIQDLGLRTTPEQLAEGIHVDSHSGSQLIRISATDASPARAAAIANHVQAELARQSGSQSPSDPVRLTVVEPARAPLRASAPDVLLDVLGGAGAGLLLGVAVLTGIGAVRAFRRPSSGGLAAPSML